MSLIQENSLNNKKKIHFLPSPPQATLAFKYASVLLCDNHWKSLISVS